MMDDLISRAAAIEYLMTNMVWYDDDGCSDEDGNEKRAILTDLVNGIPTIDAAPVIHGRWVISPGCLWPIGDCSVCGEQHIGTNSAKYCPNCGAKMDLETDH